MALRRKSVDPEYLSLLTRLAGFLGDGAALLAELLGEDNDHDGIAKRMHDTEQLADDVTHDILRRLTAGVLPPCDPEDLHALVCSLDDAMDAMDGASDRAQIYQLERLPGDFADLVQVVMRCSDLTAEAMPRVGRAGDLREYWIEVNRLENAGDRSYRRILGRLYSGAYPVPEMLKLREVAESLENAVDAFESVAKIIELIAVKRAS